MNQLLRAKHWQLFLLTFGIPFVFQMVVTIAMTIQIANQANPGDPMLMFGYMKIFPILMAFLMAVLFGWYWSVAMGLQSKVPAQVKMKVQKFKVFFFIPLIYLCAFLLFFAFIPPGQPGTLPDLDFGLIGLFMVVVLPLHFFPCFAFSIPCILSPKPLKQSSCSGKSPSPTLPESFSCFGSSRLAFGLFSPKSTEWLNRRRNDRRL